MDIALDRHLFGNPDLSAYTVLDGASVPDLLDQLFQLSPEHECLFTGDLTPDMAEVAAYLIRLTPNAEFTAWLLEKGRGQHWGIFALSYDADLKELRQHFRKFLIVQDTEGRPLRFRFYDPRVLRKFLPACNEQECTEMFGPVQQYLAEGTDPQGILRFERAANGTLKIDALDG